MFSEAALLSLVIKITSFTYTTSYNTYFLSFHNAKHHLIKQGTTYQNNFFNVLILTLRLYPLLQVSWTNSFKKLILKNTSIPKLGHSVASHPIPTYSNSHIQRRLNWLQLLGNTASLFMSGRTWMHLAKTFQLILVKNNKNVQLLMLSNQIQYNLQGK